MPDNSADNIRTTINNYGAQITSDSAESLEEVKKLYKATGFKRITFT